MRYRNRFSLALGLAAFAACQDGVPLDDAGVEAAALTVPNPEEKSAVACSLAVTSDRAGLSGTTPAMAFDGSTTTAFRSSYNDWQYLQIDYGCVGVFTGLRRYMSASGGTTTGNRGAQGEGVQYSVDGATWTSLTAATSTGWQGYVAYATGAWHSVGYGWSAWIVPSAPVRARYLRFRWDGNSDGLHEVQAQFAANRQPTDAELEAGLRAALAQVGEASTRAPRLSLGNGWPRALTVDVATIGTDAVTRARGFLSTYRGLYGLADPDRDLTPHRVYTRTLTAVRFTQRLDGKLVYGAELAVHLQGTRVVATTGAVLPYVPALPPARVTSAAAEARARTYTGMTSATLDGVTTQVFYNQSLWSGTPAPTRLAWRVILRGAHPESGVVSTWHVLVDAHNQDVLRAADQIMDEDFTISDEPSGDDWFDENGMLPDYPGVAADVSTDGIDASVFMHDTWSFYNGNFARPAWDGHDQHMPIIVHLQDNNAWYSANDDNISFGNNYVMRDIVAHEYTHGVIAKTSNLIYQDQPGALNESYADVMGALVDGDWEMRSRSLSNPPSYIGPSVKPDPTPDHMDDFWPNIGIDFGWVHFNSGIPNKAGYLITEGGTHHGITVVGIGRAKAGRVFFDTMTALPLTASFAAAAALSAANARALAATGVLGFTTSDVCQVIRGYAAVGMGANDIDCDGLSDAEDDDDDGDGFDDTWDNCPNDANPLQSDTDRDGEGDACDPDIDNDGVLNVTDNCDYDINVAQADIDHDGQGDICDADDDRDLMPDASDNCPRLYNPDQHDIDHDFVGDVCDRDKDGDLISNDADNCPSVSNANQLDSDTDGVGDLCDNCVLVANSTQIDRDEDGFGDECDADADGDGLLNTSDNCPYQPNPYQEDYDHNGIGFACDLAEQHKFHSATDAQFLRWLFEFDGRPLVRIPIEPNPCTSCPPWIDPAFTVRVELRMEIDFPVRIVDDGGNAVVTGKPGTTKVLTFQPAMDLGGRRYFLEFRRGPGTQVGKRYTMDTNIRRYPNGM